MKEVKVSIIVPIYNAEQYLSRTIKHLKNQTLKEIEIILVDDGSKDSSPAICDEACQNDKRIKCIHKNNEGVSAARNDGIQYAKGEYLLFCDADDIPDPQMSYKLLSKAEEENADVVLSGFKKQTGTFYVNCDIPYLKSISEHDEIIKKLVMPMIVWSYSPYGKTFPDIYGSVWRGLYKRRLIVNNNIFFPSSISLGEDMVFNLSVDLYSKKISFVNENLYTYIENLNSATHTNGIKIWEKYLETWKVVHHIISENQFANNDILWHNYQLSRYAVSAILEGVCPQKNNKKQKQDMVRNILNNPCLVKAVKSTPKNISKKNKLICFGIRKKMYRSLTAYYQRTYDKSI